MKNKILIFIGLIFGAHCINLFMKTDIRAPEIKTYEIKDENTCKIYLLRKIPKLKIVWFIVTNINKMSLFGLTGTYIKHLNILTDLIPMTTT